MSGSPTHAMTPSRQPSVLVVEDDVDLRRTVSEALASTGFAAAQSPDAADAIERLKSVAYDGIVIDLHLPDRSGMDVLDERALDVVTACLDQPVPDWFENPPVGGSTEAVIET